MTENVNFAGNTIEIQVLSGLAYPAMSVIVREFQSFNPDMVIPSHPYKVSSNDGEKISLSYAPPVAVFEDEKSALNDACRKYIISIANQGQDSLECVFHDTSNITWGALKVILEYQNSSSKLGDVSGSI